MLGRRTAAKGRQVLKLKDGRLYKAHHAWEGLQVSTERSIARDTREGDRVECIRQLGNQCHSNVPADQRQRKALEQRCG